MLKFDISKLDLNNPFDSRGIQEVDNPKESKETDIFSLAKKNNNENKSISSGSTLKEVLENDVADNFEYEYDLDAIEDALNNGGIVSDYDEYNLSDSKIKIKSSDSVSTAEKKLDKQQQAADKIDRAEENSKSEQDKAKSVEEMAKDSEERARDIEENSNEDEIGTDKESVENEINSDKLVNQVNKSPNSMMKQMPSELQQMNQMSALFEMPQQTEMVNPIQSMQDNLLSKEDLEGMSQEQLLELQEAYTGNLDAIQKFDAENPMPQIDLPSSLQMQSNAIAAAKDDISSKSNAEETEKTNNAAAKADVSDKKDTASEKQGALQDASKVVQDISQAVTPLQAATKMMFSQAHSTIASGQGVIATGEATVATGEATVAAGEAALAAAEAAFPVSAGAVAAAKATIASGKATIASGESAIASGEATVASGEAMEANAESMQQAVNGLQQGLKQANTVLKIAQGDFNFAELAVNTALDTLGASDTKLGEVVREVQNAKNKYDQCMTIYQTAKAVAEGNYQQALMGIGAALDSFDKLQNGTPEKEGVSTDFGKNLEKNFNDGFWKLTDDEKFDGKQGLNGNYMQDMLSTGAELASSLGAKKLGAGMLAFGAANNLASGGGKFGQNMKDVAAIASFAGNDKIAMAAGITGVGANLASGEGTLSQNFKDISKIASMSGNDKIAGFGSALASATDGIEKYNDTKTARANLRSSGNNNPTDKELNKEITNVKQNREENLQAEKSLKQKGIKNPTDTQIAQEKKNIQEQKTSEQDAIASLKTQGIKKPTDSQIKNEIEKNNEAKSSLASKGINNPTRKDMYREKASIQFEKEAKASLKAKGNNNPTKDEISIEIAYNISKKNNQN